MLETQTLGDLAYRAGQPVLEGAELAVLRTPSIVIHTSGGLLLLLMAVVLAIYKPRGVTPYGWRKQRESRVGQQERR